MAFSFILVCNGSNTIMDVISLLWYILLGMSSLLVNHSVFCLSFFVMLLLEECVMRSHLPGGSVTSILIAQSCPLTVC